MAEDTGIEIHDSLVQGDVHQYILNAECPSCSASNVKVMKCQEIQCTSIQFCELCNTNCRWGQGLRRRFDSGEGTGAFCSECLAAKEKAEAEAAAAKAKVIADAAAAKAKAESESLRRRQETIAKGRADANARRTERERAVQEKEWSRGYRWTAYVLILGYPFGLHRFCLSRISGIIYPLIFTLMHTLEYVGVVPQDFKWGIVLLILLFFDLFLIPKWSREKARNKQGSGKVPWFGSDVPPMFIDIF